MPRSIYFIAALPLLFACEASPNTSASDSAARQLAIVESHGGSLGERCDAARKLQAAFLAEENAKEYEFAKMRADAVCIRADISGYDAKS